MIPVYLRGKLYFLLWRLFVMSSGSFCHAAEFNLGELSHLRHFVLPCPKLHQPRLKGLDMGDTFKISLSFEDQD